MVIQGRGTWLDNEYVGVLAFADDLAITDINLERMNENLVIFDELIGRYSMQLNVDKTEFMTE